MREIINTASRNETFEAGKKLAESLKPGTVVLLYGDLGAGKTVFTQGIAEGLGVKTAVTSPTYTLLQSHQGTECILNHFDLYRLDSPQQVMAIGFEDIIYSDDISVIEWPERLEDELPEEYLEIKIEKGSEDNRTISMEYKEY